MRKILTIVAVALVGLSTVGVSVAASAPPEPAKAYGGCVSKSTGYLRVLERGNLAKSVNGSCKSTERKITFPSRTGVPVLPSKLVFKKAAGTDTCTKDATSTASTWTFTCTFAATPVPTPAS